MAFWNKKDKYIEVPTAGEGYSSEADETIAFPRIPDYTSDGELADDDFTIDDEEPAPAPAPAHRGAHARHARIDVQFDDEGDEEFEDDELGRDADLGEPSDEDLAGFDDPYDEPFDDAPISDESAFAAFAEAQDADGDAAAEPEKPHGKKKKAAIIAGAIVGALALVYVGGGAFFSGHFMPGTSLNGIDVSWKAPADVQSDVAASLADYKLTIKGFEYEQTIAGADISYGLDEQGDMLAETNPWTWPVQIVQGTDSGARIPVTYDEEALKALLDEGIAAHNEDARPSLDAHLDYDEASDKIVVKPEEWGTQLNEAAVLTVAEQALKAVGNTVELTQDQVKPPVLFSNNEGLAHEAEQVNQLSNVNLTLTMGGYDALKINKGNLLDWIITDDNHNVSLQPEKVEQWAETVATKLNTSSGEHHYTRPDGKEVTVYGGDYGWSVDVEALEQIIIDAVTEGTTGTIEIPCTSTANYYNIETGAEWTRFIDVDLSEQHAYFFDEDGSVIWESDIISGNVNISGRETPTGVYTITRMATNETLYTYEAGKKEPNKTVVNYWMPFIGNVYALHDAWWQPGFGGTMYRDGYGSHGCVNLPSDAAGELYYMANVGDVVVVHW